MKIDELINTASVMMAKGVVAMDESIAKYCGCFFGITWCRLAANLLFRLQVNSSLALETCTIGAPPGYPIQCKLKFI